MSDEANKFFADLDKLQKINPNIPVDFKGFIDGGNLADKTLIEFLSTTDKSSVSLENYNKHLQSVGKTTTVAAKAMSGLKKAGAILASMGTAFLVMEGISLAIKAVNDHFHQYTNALEKASSAADEYATQKSNVQELTSEYDTLQSKIKELQALQSNGTITMQQEIELTNLQNQSSELERQLDIQKQILDIKAQASANAAKEAAKEEKSYIEMNQEKYGDFWGTITGALGYVGYFSRGGAKEWKDRDTTLTGLTKANLYELETLDGQLKRKREEISKNPENEDLLTEESEILEDIASIKSELSSQVEEIQGLIDQSLDSNGLPVEGSEKFVDNLRSIVTEYQNYGKSIKEIDLNNLNNYFSSSAGNAMKNYLSGIVKDGGSAEDALKAFKRTGMSLDDIGVSESGFVRYFEDIKNAANKATEAVQKANNNLTMGDIGIAFDSANAGADYVTFNDYLKQAKELFDQGLIGTDEFKAVTEMMTYNLDSSAEAFAESYDRIKKFWIEDDKGNLTPQGINNFLTQLQGLEKGYATWDETAQKWKIDIDNTAQAAKDLNIGVGVFEAILGRIKDYDGVGDFNFVSTLKEFDEAKTSLEQLKELYDSMDESSDKEALKLKLDKWTPLIENAEQDLASLPDEVVTELKFEYDKAQLLQEATDATNLAKNSGWKDSSYNANAIVTAEKYKARLAEGFDISSVAEQSVPVYFNAENALQNLRAQLESGNLNESATLEVQAEIINLLNLQNEISEAFQNTHPEITPETDPTVAQQTFDAWIKSAEGQKIVASTTLDYKDAIDKMSKLVNEDYDDIKIDINAQDNASAVIQNVENQELKDKITKLRGEDEATYLVAIWNSLPANIKETKLTASDQATYLISLWNAMTPEQKTAIMTAVDESASSTAKTVTGAVEEIPESSDTKIKASDSATPVIHSVLAQLNAANGKTAHTYLYNHVINSPSSGSGAKTNNKSSGGANTGKGFLSGTAHKDGTVGGLYPIPKLSSRALAMGTLQDTSWLKPSWKTTKNEVALTGEVGREIVVKGNRWWTVGDNGAEFASIPQGSVVFNAKQSEELLSKGFTNSRGTALLSGTAYLGSASGSFSFGGGATAYNKPGYQGSKSSSSTKSAEDAAKDALDAISGYFDWVKVRFDRLARETELAENAIEDAVGLSAKQSATLNTISKVQAELVAAQAGADRYLSHANWYAGQSGLSADIQNQVKSGTIDISKYDEDTQKKISEYQSWYENYLEAIDKVAELQRKETELAHQRLENIEDFYNLVNDVHSSLEDAIDASLELDELKGFSAVSDSVKQSIQKQIESAESIYNTTAQQLTEYQTEFNNLVSKGYIREGSDSWYEGQAKLNEFNQALAEAGSSVIEFQDKLMEIEYTKIQNIIDGFDRAVSKLDKKIELMEARDEKIPESIYQEQLDTNNSQILANMELRDKKLKEQGLYDVNSTRYQELAEEINKLDEETLQLMTDNEKLKDSIFELRFSDLDEAIENYDKLGNEVEDFLDLLNEEAYFDKTGKGTADLTAALALMQQGMIVSKQKVSDLQKGLDKLQESFDSGVISEKEYTEKSEEYRDGIIDAISVTKDYKDTITDLYKTQMNKEAEATTELIEKYDDARNAKERYYEFDKKLKNQTKNVNLLKAQIAALDSVSIFAECVLIAGNP